MARGRGLYLKIPEPDNLRLAFNKAVKGKSDRQEVIRFRHDLDENLAALRRELQSGEISLGPDRFFTILDPKERIICAAPFHDRVLHHAVMNICEPVFERYSIFDSYACRPAKGLHKAITRAQEFSRQYQWYLKLDIRKYFYSIDHKILNRLLARRFADTRLLALFDRVISSSQGAPGKGIPIGNLMSQHFANFYLGLMDHWLKEERRIGGYLRYMDDCLLFGDSKEMLKVELNEIERFLEHNLSLLVKNNRQLNRCSCGIPFLGFRVFPHEIRLSPRSRRRFSAKLVYYEQEASAGKLSERELARRVSSMVSFTQTAAAAGFRRYVINKTRGMV